LVVDVRTETSNHLNEVSFLTFLISCTATICENRLRIERSVVGRSRLALPLAGLCFGGFGNVGQDVETAASIARRIL
jgi:hypothetical protein